ncbi:MAG: D-alanyl-D-alanine carboxypeptidase [Kiritimatiellae bacterium]|nr:D-alanyl-D-alanine carboxypeptidase [Kiritimatiellia bacterium]
MHAFSRTPFRFSALAALALAAVLAAPAPLRAATPGSIAEDPYVGAIVVDARTGEVLREDRAGRPAYPASMLKLMNLYVTLDAVSAGRVALSDVVPVTRAAASIGGSQVYLDPRESFPLSELVYAMMIQSANDAAYLVAEHVAGSASAFVDLMNQKARDLGLSPVTRFVSPHGLPPKDGRPDITTAADFAKVCVGLLRDHPEALEYTSATYRQFRPDARPPFSPFDMRTHNPLLGSFPGCDGLKTGYFSRAGYSIAVTASRDGRRAIAVVLGSASKASRNDAARSWLEYGLARASAAPAAPPPDVAPANGDNPSVLAVVEEPADDSTAPAEEPAPEKKGGFAKFLVWTVVLLLVGWIVLKVVKRRLLVSRNANVHVRK